MTELTLLIFKVTELKLLKICLSYISIFFNIVISINKLKK